MVHERVNIAFLIDTISCDTAGTQKQLMEIVRRLNKDLFTAHIICLYTSPWIENNELPCLVTVLGYQGFLKRNFPNVLLKLRKIVNQAPVHILQTFFEDSIFVAFLATVGMARRRCVLLSSRRDIGLGGNRPWYHRLFSLVLPLVSRQFDGLVANGQEVKKWVVQREKVSSEKIRVIPNGTALPGPSGGMPELFGRYLSPLWIGMVANLTPIKRIDVFLRALHIIVEKRPDIQFRAVLLGDGPERETLLNLARECQITDRVHFQGAVKEVSSYLERLDIGVLCSDREGFSNAVLEYMAHALPVVVTAVGGNTELVDQTTGLCVPAGDSMILADALIRLADDPALRTKLGKAGREKVRKIYSWDRSMEALESYYSQLLAAKVDRV